MTVVLKPEYEFSVALDWVEENFGEIVEVKRVDPFNAKIGYCYVGMDLPGWDFAIWDTSPDGGLYEDGLSPVGAVANALSYAIPGEAKKLIQSRLTVNLDTPRTEVDLEPIKKREHAATPGPWKNWGGTQTHAINSGTERIVGCDCEVEYRGGIQKMADAEFIAHARQDIPALIAEVERLRNATPDAHHPKPE